MVKSDSLSTGSTLSGREVHFFWPLRRNRPLSPLRYRMPVPTLSLAPRLRSSSSASASVRKQRRKGGWLSWPGQGKRKGRSLPELLSTMRQKKRIRDSTICMKTYFLALLPPSCLCLPGAEFSHVSFYFTLAAPPMVEFYLDSSVLYATSHIIPLRCFNQFLGNEKFVNITDLAEDEISELLTVFNLVQSDYIPRLFNLFSLALRGGSPPPLRLHSSDESSSDCGSACETSPPAHGAANAQCGQDDACSSTDDAIKHDVGECSSENESANRESSDDYQHVSMVVPCATFKNKQESYCVTITLMNDIDPRRRCFHCVFGDSAQPMQAENDVPVRDKCPTEKSSAEFGIIRRISYASLARQL